MINRFTITFIVFLLYGLFMVLLYNGVVRFIEDILNITWAWSLALGLIGVISLVFFLGFRRFIR